jgi:hypothetical protein
MSLFSRMFEKSRKPQEPAVLAPAAHAVPLREPAQAPAPVTQIRLVVWGLDVIFWPGAMRDGPATCREDVSALVRALAGRGIASSVCARGHLEDAEAALTDAGIWALLVQPSIGMAPVGPRLAALATALDMPADVILFVDDGARSRAEAEFFLPGIHLASGDVVTGMLEQPALQGAPDAEHATLARLRTMPAAAPPGDFAPFLRTNGVTVTIEYDIAPHIDRALALINDAHALNLSMLRLPPDLEGAAAQLRNILSRQWVQAGLIRVSDNTSDYGYCGLYIMVNKADGKRLTHFGFSDDVRDMGVETWLYRRLGCPALAAEGEQAVDTVGAGRLIDWIRLSVPQAPPVDAVYARGGTDLSAVAHYFEMLGVRVRCDCNVVRHGAAVALQHSVIARHAIDGISPAALDALLPLGFAAPDFTPPPAGRGLWLLSFWMDGQAAVWRHRSTGALVPYRESRPGKDDDGDTADEQARRAYLKLNFEPLGPIEADMFKENLAALLHHAGPAARVVILLMNEKRKVPDRKGETVIARNREVNAWTRQVAADHPHVELLNVVDFAQAPDEVGNGRLFDRMVYVRVYQHLLGCAG